MTTRRITTINEVIVDASQAERGFQAYKQASREAAQATAQQTEATERESAALQRLARQIDPAAAMQQKFERGTRTLNEEFRRGRISGDRYAEMARQLENRFGPAARSADQLEQRISRVNRVMAGGQDVLRGYAAQAGPLGDILQSVGRGGLAAAAGLAALVVAGRELTQLTSAALASANALSDQARNIGITAEALQELRFAAASVGVDTAKADSSLERFTRRLGEARQGTGAFQATAERLNIDLGNSDQALQQVFEALANTEDAADRAAIASAAFGREGVAFAAIADDIARLRQEARDAGAVIENELTDRAADLNTTLSQTRSAFSTAFDAGLLREVVGPLEDIAEDTRELTALAETLGTIAGRAASTVLGILVEINTLLSGESGILAKLQSFVLLVSPLANVIQGANDFAGSFGGDPEGINAISESFEGLTFAITETGDARDDFTGNNRPFRVELESTGTAAGEAADQVGSFFETLADENRLLFELSDGLRDGSIAVEDLAIERRILNEAQRLGIEQGTDEFNFLRDLVEVNARLEGSINDVTEAHRENGQAAERAVQEASQAAERELREYTPCLAPITVDISSLFEAENEDDRHEHLCDQRDPEGNQGGLRQQDEHSGRRERGRNQQIARQSADRHRVLRNRPKHGSAGVRIALPQIHDTVGSC